MGGPSQTGTTNQDSNTNLHIPPFLRQYYKTIAGDYMNGMQNLPNISQLYQGTPLLGTAQLTGDENNLINQFQQNVGPNTAENASQYGFNQFAGGGPNQPSSATQAAMKEFNDLQAPEIQSQAALQGLGTSGASLAALAQGQEQAAVPFLQQDLQNQLTAAQGLGQLGGQEASQMQTQLQDALQAAGMPREIAQQIMQNQFNQQQQQWNFAQGIQTGGASQFPSLIGGGSSQGSSTTSAPKF
jgi:hypothetical protein